MFAIGDPLQLFYKALAYLMVRTTGLEPARVFTHKHLKLAWLPITPYPHISCYLSSGGQPLHPLDIMP